MLNVQVQTLRNHYLLDLMMFTKLMFMKSCSFVKNLRSMICESLQSCGCTTTIAHQKARGRPWGCTSPPADCSPAGSAFPALWHGLTDPCCLVVLLARARQVTALRPQPNPPNPALPRPARPPSPSLLPTLLTPAHNTLPLRSAGKGHCACGEGQHHRPDDGLHMGHLDLLDLPGLQHMGSLGYQNCRILQDLTKIYIAVF